MTSPDFSGTGFSSLTPSSLTIAFSETNFPSSSLFLGLLGWHLEVPPLVIVVPASANFLGSTNGEPKAAGPRL